MNAKAAELKERIERGDYPSQRILDVATDRALCDALWGDGKSIPQSDHSSDPGGDTDGLQGLQHNGKQESRMTPVPSV